MNSYTVEIIWQGKEWLEPSTGIKLTGIKAETKKDAGVKALNLIANFSPLWKVVNVQEEA